MSEAMSDLNISITRSSLRKRVSNNKDNLTNEPFSNAQRTGVTKNKNNDTAKRYTKQANGAAKKKDVRSKRDCDNSKENKQPSSLQSSQNHDAAGSRVQKNREKHKDVALSNSKVDNIKVLQDWIIKPVPDLKGICVEGQLQGQQEGYWHSSPIVDALKPDLVVTAAGSKYKLKGKINLLLTVDSGIAVSIAKAFKAGFPANWKDLIEKYYKDMITSITITEECLTPEKFQLYKAKQKKGKEQLNRSLDIHSIVTPKGLLRKEMSNSELTMTRSGRISLPPLAGWAGQHYDRHSKSDSVSISFKTDHARDVLSNQTLELLGCKQIKSMLCCSLSKSFLAHSSKTNRNKKGSPSSVPNNKSLSKKAKSRCTSPVKDNCTDDKNVESTRNARKGKSVNIKNISDKNTLVNIQNALNMSENSDPRLSPIVELTDCSLSHDQSEKVQPLIGKDHGKTGNNKKSNFKNNPKAIITKTSDGLKNDASEENKSSQSKKSNSTKNTNSGNSKSKLQSTNKASKSKASIRNTVSASNSPKSDTLGENDTVHNLQTSTISEKKKRKNSNTAKAGRKRKDSGDNYEAVKPPKQSRLSSQADVDEEGWTQQEKGKLNRAVSEVSADMPDFWDAVAGRVGTKSQEQCQHYHKLQLEKKTKVCQRPVAAANKQKNNTGRKKGDPIRGGKGTLKRKQDIRDLLDEQNEGYEDDLLAGTPFAKFRKNPVMNDVSIDFINDSDVFGANHNFFTPIASRNPFDTPGLRLKAQMASVRKTPADQSSKVAFEPTPITVNNRNNDLYIKNFMDKKKKQQLTKIDENTTSPAADLESSILPIRSLFSTTPVIQFDNMHHDDDDDDDNDEDAEENGNRFMYHWHDADLS